MGLTVQAKGSAARASADIQHAKLRIDTRKWLLSKLAPQRYGDRIQHEHSGDVVVTTRIHWVVQHVEIDYAPRRADDCPISSFRQLF